MIKTIVLFQYVLNISPKNGQVRKLLRQLAVGTPSHLSWQKKDKPFPASNPLSLVSSAPSASHKILRSRDLLWNNLLQPQKQTQEVFKKKTWRRALCNCGSPLTASSGAKLKKSSIKYAGCGSTSQVDSRLSFRFYAIDSQNWTKHEQWLW